MTTTIDSLVPYPAKAHNHVVAFGIAAVLFVGAALGTTAVIANNDNGSVKAPPHASQPFDAQPLLKVSGPR